MAKLSITKGDKIVIASIIIVCLLISGGFALRARHANAGSYVTVVRADTNEETQYSLKKSRNIEVQGYLGTSIIEISQGKARFVSSPCPDNVCVDFFGWIEKEGEISVCLPNQILLKVEEKVSH
ncbi:MAG: NusG domain II-containing protein [Firmicutes bacterium]|nr:NusG domain II-containing protein [Bacillota bacterium]